jgi:hypothetical protein
MDTNTLQIKNATPEEVHNWQSIWHDVSSNVFKHIFLLINNAIKAVIGVGKKTDGKFEIKPLAIIWFALLVAFFFLGTVSLLLLLTSLIITV